MTDTNATRAAGSSAPACLAGRWRWRVACIGSHIALRYGFHAVDETHGGQAVHYGWPRRSIGLEWSWRHNTWFAGWELWPNNAVRGAAEPHGRQGVTP